MWPVSSQPGNSRVRIPTSRQESVWKETHPWVRSRLHTLRDFTWGFKGSQLRTDVCFNKIFVLSCVAFYFGLAQHQWLLTHFGGWCHDVSDLDFGLYCRIETGGGVGVRRRDELNCPWTEYNTGRILELFNDVIANTIIIPGGYDVFLYILCLSTPCSSSDLWKSEPLLLKVSVWRNFRLRRIKKKFTFFFSKSFQPSLASDPHCGQGRFTCVL